MLLNLVDLGTGFQMEIFLKMGWGTPPSLQCLDAVMQYWVAWAGYPGNIDRSRTEQQRCVREGVVRGRRETL